MFAVHVKVDAKLPSDQSQTSDSLHADASFSFHSCVIAFLIVTAAVGQQNGVQNFK